MFRKMITAMAIGVLTVSAAACGSSAGAGDEPADGPGDAPAACLEGDPDCYEDGTEGDGAGSACPVGDADCYEDGTEGDANPPGLGMCAPDVTDCEDVVVVDGGDEFPVEQARQETQGLLGRYEDDLAPDVRIGRRGDELMALTEDYVLGRMTVELEDTDGDGFRVVAATVELPDGPETFELTPG